ncbi:MAG: hypothetical protein ACLFS8_01395, partial [Clostridia bacterium]
MSEGLRRIGKNAGYFIVALFSAATYAIVVVPGTLEYSHLAFFVILGFGLFSALLLTEETWLSYGVCVVGAAAMRAGLDSLVSLSGSDFAIRAFVVVFVISVVMLLYGRIRVEAVLAVALAVLLLSIAAPGDQLRVHNAFRVIDAGPALYDSQVFEYFPTRQVQTPEGPRILTLGDAEGRDANDGSLPERVLTDQELTARVFVPQDRELREKHDAPSPLDLGDYYPAFPYYHLRSRGVEAALSTVDLVEGAMTFGNAPRLGLKLALDAIAERLDAREGVEDVAIVEDVGKVVLASGRLTVESGNGESFDVATPATHIVGGVHTPGGLGVALLGEELQIFAVREDGLELSHTLDDDIVADVAMAEFFAADVTGDGRDELVMSSIHSPSRILRPTAGGDWDTLWVANEDDPTFRFETVVDWGSGPEIVAQSHSRTRAHPLRYLSGYRLAGDTLVPTWRTMTT